MRDQYHFRGGSTQLLSLFKEVQPDILQALCLSGGFWDCLGHSSPSQELEDMGIKIADKENLKPDEQASSHSP